MFLKRGLFMEEECPSDMQEILNEVWLSGTTNLDFSDRINAGWLKKEAQVTNHTVRAQNINQALLICRSGQELDEHQLIEVFDIFFGFKIFEGNTYQYYFDPGSKKRAGLIFDYLRKLTHEEFDQLMQRIDNTYENQVKTFQMPTDLTE